MLCALLRGFFILDNEENFYMRTQKITISVIGGHEISSEVDQLAHNIGKIVASVGAILVCGGLSGVMKSAAKGCKESGGLTIGLLPGKEKSDANEFIDIALPTSIGFARNAMVACSADIIIALPGSHGTACEISYGIVYNRPIIDLGNWNQKELVKVESLEDAEQKIREIIKVIKGKTFE